MGATRVKTKKQDAARPATFLPAMIGVPPGTLGFLSKAQIASTLQVSQSTFKLMLAGKVSPSYPPATIHFGKLPRWSVADHNAWCHERQAEKEARLRAVAEQEGA